MTAQATVPLAPQRVRAIVDRYRMAVERGDPALMAENYAADALLDLNVPRWRYQLQGREAILQGFAEWLTAPPNVTSWREWASDEGAIVELALFVGDEDEPRYYRQANLLRIEDEHVVEHVIYCSGGWDLDTVMRQQDEAPMIRP